MPFGCLHIYAIYHFDPSSHHMPFLIQCPSRPGNSAEREEQKHVYLFVCEQLFVSIFVGPELSELMRALT